MKFSEKILLLRKNAGLSQEALAEQLHLSRQAVSRWESGSAMPDAANILQLSRLFGVSADRLLDDTLAPSAAPAESAKAPQTEQLMFYLLALEVMALLLQVMTVFILQNAFFALLSFLPFVCMIGGFEYAYRKQPPTAATRAFRKRFYKISAWLGLYFPVRFVLMAAARLYPLPSPALECVILAVYICAALCICLSIDKADL